MINLNHLAVKLAMGMDITASVAEQEVERLFRAFLPGTPFEGKMFIVGGYVRDEYLKQITKDEKIEPKDLDIVVDSTKTTSEQATKFIADHFNKISPESISTPRKMGAAYPIWQIVFKTNIEFKGETYHTKGAQIEFADSQKEHFPDPASRQRVTEPGTIHEDILRRDFTINMMLKDLTTGEIKDFTGRSKKDIEKGLITGHPDVSLDDMFSNDPLRMIRAARFQAKYGWTIPQYMKDAIKKNAHRIEIVSSERITEELKKVMKYGKLADTVRFMVETGLIKYISHEVEALKGSEHSKLHHQEGDVLTHTLMVLDNTGPGIVSQMAALLHDVGKPATKEIIEDKISNKGHEAVSGQIAEAVMTRLRFDGDDIKKVRRIVENHMRPHSLAREIGRSGLSTKAIRKFIRDVGEDIVDAVLDLARADELGKLPPTNAIPDLRKKIDEVRKQTPSVSKKPLLDGNEIMALGVPQGPRVKEIMKFVTDLEDDYIEKGKTLTKEEASEKVREKFL